MMDIVTALKKGSNLSESTILVKQWAAPISTFLGEIKQDCLYSTLLFLCFQYIEFSGFLIFIMVCAYAVVVLPQAPDDEPQKC